MASKQQFGRTETCLFCFLCLTGLHWASASINNSRFFFFDSAIKQGFSWCCAFIKSLLLLWGSYHSGPVWPVCGGFCIVNVLMSASQVRLAPVNPSGPEGVFRNALQKTWAKPEHSNNSENQRTMISPSLYYMRLIWKMLRPHLAHQAMKVTPVKGCIRPDRVQTIFLLYCTRTLGLNFQLLRTYKVSRDPPISQAPTYAYRKCTAAPLHPASLRVHLPCCLFEAAVCCVRCACSASLKCPEDRSEITPLQREAGFREREKKGNKERGGGWMNQEQKRR